MLRITLSLVPETHKGLKRVTLISLLCPMLVIVHFRNCHIGTRRKDTGFVRVLKTLEF